MPVPIRPYVARAVSPREAVQADKVAARTRDAAVKLWEIAASASDPQHFSSYYILGHDVLSLTVGQYYGDVQPTGSRDALEIGYDLEGDALLQAHKIMPEYELTQDGLRLCETRIMPVKTFADGQTILWAGSVAENGAFSRQRMLKYQETGPITVANYTNATATLSKIAGSAGVPQPRFE
jgi:hypothetical protein